MPNQGLTAEAALTAEVTLIVEVAPTVEATVEVTLIHAHQKVKVAKAVIVEVVVMMVVEDKVVEKRIRMYQAKEVIFFFLPNFFSFVD